MPCGGSSSGYHECHRTCSAVFKTFQSESIFCSILVKYKNKAGVWCSRSCPASDGTGLVDRRKHSNLPRPLHPFPDREIDKDPGQGQRANQRPAKLSWLFKTTRHLVHVTPTGPNIQTSTNSFQHSLVWCMLHTQYVADLLPKLGDSAGQVGGIRQAVVGKTFVCVPGVVTALPR